MFHSLLCFRLSGSFSVLLLVDTPWVIGRHNIKQVDMATFAKPENALKRAEGKLQSFLS